MKSIFIVVTVLACAAIARAQDRDALRQVAGILAYVGTDYAAAVGPEGTVVSDLEYREQFTLLEEAIALAARAGLASDDPLHAGLRELRPLLEARVEPTRVAEHCRRLTEDLVRRLQVPLQPATNPDRDAARALYAAHGCATCHGERGAGDGPAGARLDPPPASFLDPERMADVSPFRAFAAIRWGVRGTAMTAYPALTDAEVWSLAFFLTGWRHEDPEAHERGRALLERAGWPVDPSVRSLALASENDLRASLAGIDASGGDDALAYLRGAAPFATATHAGGWSLTRRRLREGLEAYRRGERDEARRLFVSAYLDGFEPLEASLQARDPGLVLRIEEQMLALRERAAAGAPPAEIESRWRALGELLDEAQRGRTDGAAAFAGSLLIALREGFEAVLLVTTLLALSRRRNVEGGARAVHGGWLAAVAAGVLTWLAAGAILGGLERELAEGVVALLAAFVLLGVTHWVVGQATSRGFFGAAMRWTAGERTTRWGLFALAFVTVYREAFEVVLFYQALLLDAAAHLVAIVAGVLVAAVALALLALGLRWAGRRLDPRRFMLASGAVLALLAVVLVGKGVRALQEAAVLPLTPLGTGPHVEALGLYPTLEGLLAQGLLAALLLASVFWMRNPPKDAPRSADAPASATTPSPVEKRATEH
ncbi:MAG: FTR1 family protein [Myxococcota bacterium]|nr:FTR1 family protein [Myxococcota bacterium]